MLFDYFHNLNLALPLDFSALLQFTQRMAIKERQEQAFGHLRLEESPLEGDPKILNAGHRTRPSQLNNQSGLLHTPRVFHGKAMLAQEAKPST